MGNLERSKRNQIMRNYIFYFILSQIHLVNGDDETVIPEIQLLNVDYEVGFGLDLHRTSRKYRKVKRLEEFTEEKYRNSEADIIQVLYKHLNDTVTQCTETFDHMIDWYLDCYHLEGLSSTEFDYYMAYKEENIIEILNTLELDGYIRIPRNPKKAEQIKKALEEERNLDLSDHLGFGNFFAGHISEQFEKTISQIDPEITKKELKIRETYRKRRSASGKVRRQIIPKIINKLSPEGEPNGEVHLPCDMSPEYTNFTFFETFESSFKNLLELSLDQLEINEQMFQLFQVIKDLHKSFSAQCFDEMNKFPISQKLN